MCQLQFEKLDGAYSQPVPVYRHAGESSTWCLPLLPHRLRRRRLVVVAMIALMQR